MFPDGTVVRKGFKGPILENGRRAWRGYRYLQGKVLSVRTERKSRRHFYNLQWEGDENTIALAGVVSRVDEGYVKRYRET